jgi:hypothetical protein
MEWLAVAVQRAHMAVGCLVRVEPVLPDVVADSVLAAAEFAVAGAVLVSAVAEKRSEKAARVSRVLPVVECFGCSGCAGAAAVAHVVPHSAEVPDQNSDMLGTDCHIR